MKSLFIAGTDTGVGKTVVAAALLTTLRARGLDAVPMKPVQTGCLSNDSGLVAPDLEFCLNMAGLQPTGQEREWMAPYCFEPACSPHLAARQAGVAVSLTRIQDAFRNLLQRHQLVLVEGAGGILSPVNDQEFMLDVMTSLGGPVLLVARAGLGTLNHTLLSLRVLQAARVNVIGVVLVDTRPTEWGPIEQDNAITIEKHGGVAVVIRLPGLYDAETGWMNRAKFRHLAALSLQPLLELPGVAP